MDQFECVVLCGGAAKSCEIRTVSREGLAQIIDSWRQDAKKLDGGNVEKHVGLAVQWPWLEFVGELSAVGALYVEGRKEPVALIAAGLNDLTEDGEPAVGGYLLAKSVYAHDAQIKVAEPCLNWLKSMSGDLGFGGRVVLVDVLNDDLVGYYKRFGFKQVGSDAGGRYYMELGD